MSTLAHKTIPTAMNISYYYTFRFEEEFDSVKIRPYIETQWRVVVLTSLGKRGDTCVEKKALQCVR